MTSKYNILTQERIKEILSYDMETGLFTWLVSNSNRVSVGDVAGYKKLASGTGKHYIVIRINKELYYAHQLVWLYMHGKFTKYPIEETDHIDGNGCNNSFNNLRIVSKNENHKNVRLQSNNTSGVCGVSWDSSRSKWVAAIKINQSTKMIGRFKEKTMR